MGFFYAPVPMLPGRRVMRGRSPLAVGGIPAVCRVTAAKPGDAVNQG
jgi:hypothetical protein